MIVVADDHLRPFLAVAIVHLARQMKDHEKTPPPQAIELARALMPDLPAEFFDSAVRHDHEPSSRTGQARARSLAAQRSARYRARRRGELVPLRRPGPPADRDGLGLAG